MPALYATIWIALALFAVGESGRSLCPPGTRPPAWAWWAFASGLALAIVHTAIAFDVVHHWVHDDAVRATALQTEAVYGMAVGWGIYVNYLFLAAWLADAWWWRSAPDSVRPAWIMWGLRAFYLIVIFNAAVVFAAGVRKALGAAIVSWLVRLWSGRHEPLGRAPQPRR